jgi:PAS domain S-box-containing protein
VRSLGRAVYSGGKIVKLAGTFQNVDKYKRAEEQLQEERNLLRTLIDHIPDKVYVKDKDSRFVVCNKKTNEYWHEKCNDGTIVGKRDFDLFEPEMAQQFFDEERKLMSTGRPINNIESNYIDKAGNIHYVLTTKVPIKDSHDNVTGLLGIHRNITERKLAEERLEQERTLLRTLIDHIPDVVYVKDKDGRFIICNKAVAGYWETEGKGNLIGKTDFDLFEPDKAQVFFDEEQKLMQTGQLLTNQERAITDKAGNVRSGLTTKVPLRDSRGNITGLVGINRDITERKQVEQALKTSEERFRSLFEQAADAIVVIDARTGEMAEFNDKAHQMLGYTREEYKKLRLSDIEAIESKEEVAAHIDKVVRQGSDIFEAKQRKKDGTLCDVLVSSKLITVAGKPYLQAIWRDITELKKAEGTLLEYQKQLKQLASQLALTEERERRRIAGKIHDEISQTLAMAKIKLDTLRSSPPSEASSAAIEEISSYIEKVIQETRTLTFELSNPILYELGFEAAVAEWLDEQVRDKHGIATEFIDDSKAKPLDDDVRVLLFRNVRELLINVIKHANTGKVRVGVRKIDDTLEVVVEDNGIGFDLAEVRTMAAKRAEFGLLSIRESLEELGGRFEIETWRRM